MPNETFKNKNVSWIEIFEVYPKLRNVLTCKIYLEIGTLLKARVFSISSAPEADKTRVDLTIGLAQYKS